MLYGVTEDMQKHLSPLGHLWGEPLTMICDASFIIYVILIQFVFSHLLLQYSVCLYVYK